MATTTRKAAGKAAAPRKAAAKAAGKRTGATARTRALRKPAKQAVRAPAKAAKRSRSAARAPSAARRHSAPGKLRLSMMTGNYEIVRALKDGTVKPKGIELVIGGYPGATDIHNRVAGGKGCDINEFNGGHYVAQKAHGRDDFTAIPVFLHRRFRHGFIYVNTSKNITRPSDLTGKRIGSYSIGAAANYWMRGYLEEAGVPLKSVTWVVEHTDDVTENAPADLKIELTPRGRKIEDMLLEGEVECMISPSVTKMIDTKDPRVSRLWPNYREVELQYYRRTGFFPIMHVTTVPSEIVARYPWVVESLTLAFEEAKQLAYQHLINPRIVPLAWFRSYWEEEHEILGSDPWEYGLSERNRRNYDTLVGYVHQQVLTGARPRLEDLFPKEAFELELPLPKLHYTVYGF
jgi:4,5-dihydroxyphthalate decarboxylase